MSNNYDFTRPNNDDSTQRLNTQQPSLQPNPYNTNPRNNSNLPPMVNNHNNMHTQYNSPQRKKNNGLSTINIIVIAVSVIAIILAIYIFIINPLVSKSENDSKEETSTENITESTLNSVEDQPTTIAPTESSSNPSTQQKKQEQSKPEPINNSAVFAQLESNMISVSGGTFAMGATYEQDEAMDREYPVHEVSLSSFKICRYEVTQELWEAVMGSNPSRNRGAKRPVDNVSWNDCQSFIKKLNSLTGKNYRLPTEAEWEFAARGGNYSQNNKYSGSYYADETAWHSGNSGNTSHNVGQKQPNEPGLYDMSGNVFEWCNDRYGNYSYNSQYNPTGPSSGNTRVGRGGGYNLGAKFCRVSGRTPGKTNYKSTSLGLRLAHN